MKTTEQFINEIKLNPKHTPVEGRSQIDVTTFLSQQLADIKLKSMFTYLDIDPTNGYKYVNGTRTLTRDIFLKILIYLQFDFEAIQGYLKQFEFPPLYAKNKRDNAIIYCLYHNYNYLEVKAYLATHNIIGL